MQDPTRKGKDTRPAPGGNPAHVPVDDAAEDPQAIEDSLEREAPNERRDRLSPEYGNAATGEGTPQETRFQPDGKEVYPEPDAEFRARGGNIEGSLQKQQEDSANPEPALEGPDVSTTQKNDESDAQGAELEGHEE